MATFQFVGQNNGHSTRAGVVQYVNMFPHPTQDGRLIVFNTPGLTKVTTVGSIPIRGWYVWGSYAYCVSYNKVIRLDSSWNQLQVGTIASYSGNVSFSDNSQQLMLVDGSNGYLYMPSPWLISAPVVVGVGSGYTNGDVLTLVGGQYGTQATLTVTGVSGGQITSASVTNAGQYFNPMSGTLSVTGGTGSGATFTVTSTQTAASPGPFANINTWNASVPAFDTVTYMDGYFIANKRQDRLFFYSGLYDGTNWNALNYNAAAATSDVLVAVVATFSTLILLGQNHTEIWYDSGDPLNVFTRIDGATSNVGCLAPWSVSRVGETGQMVCWIATSPRGNGFAVANTGGAQNQRISSPEVEYQWAQYSTLADAVGYGYIMSGHSFYVIHFPTANKTWVYDIALQQWHELSSNGGRHLSNFMIYWNNNHYVSSYADGSIYQMKFGIYTDDGAAIQRMIVSPTLGNDEQGLTSYQSLEVDTEKGQGLISGQGTNPQIMMSWSDDGGYSWSQERFGTTGPQGEYDRRTIWRRLGRSFRRTYKLRSTDPVKTVILAAVVKTID